MYGPEKSIYFYHIHSFAINIQSSRLFYMSCCKYLFMDGMEEGFFFVFSFIIIFCEGGFFISFRFLDKQ